MNYKERISALREQVERLDDHTERKCAEHLIKIPGVLLSPLDDAFYVDSELNCQAGRVDLAIIANVDQTGGESRRSAYVWELKAPQLYLFRLESNSRACPYIDFLKAENQLIHYYDFLANDGGFRDRWDIISHNDVYFGGIIIGRDANLVKYNTQQQAIKAKHLASQALRIRQRLFYERNNIRMWTWDRVLDFAERYAQSHQRFEGDPEGTIDFNASVPYTEPPIEESL